MKGRDKIEVDLLTPPGTPPPGVTSHDLTPTTTISTTTTSDALQDHRRSQFWHRARLAKHQARPPNVESMMSLVLFISRTVQMSRARKEGSLKFAVMKKIATAAASAPPTPPLTSANPTFSTKEKEKEDTKPTRPPMASMQSALAVSPLAPRAPASALLGLSLLGNFDPLFPPPNQPTTHLSSPTPPFDPISLGAGCRLKPGGSLLYAYTFDAQLTVVIGYDGGVMGLEEEGMERLWKGVRRGLEGTEWI